MHVTSIAALVALAIAAASTAASQQVPAKLAELAAVARLDRPVVAWCAGEFRSGHAGAYAVAIASASGGRYLVLESGQPVVELGRFTGGPDISCYTPAEARKLDLALRASDTISGRIAPEWATTVVCAFVENTRAVCWQHSPRNGAFVKVGEWVT